MDERSCPASQSRKKLSDIGLKPNLRVVDLSVRPAESVSCWRGLCLGVGDFLASRRRG